MYGSTSSNYNSPVGSLPNHSLETVDEELTVLRKALHDLGHKIKSADREVETNRSLKIRSFV